MFRAIMCPSSGENTVTMRHLVFVTIYRWLPGMQGGIPPCIPDIQLYRVTNTRCLIGTVFSPDAGHSCPKHVEKFNKHIKKIWAPSWFYLQNICNFITLWPPTYLGHTRSHFQGGKIKHTNIYLRVEIILQITKIIIVFVKNIVYMTQQRECKIWQVKNWYI